MVLGLSFCRLTLDHGLHYQSAATIATLAATVMILKNDHATASHLCDMAFAIQKQLGRHNAARTLFTSVVFTLGCIRPLHELLPLTMDGYSQGMKEGDNLYGTWVSLSVHLKVLLQSKQCC